MDSAGSADYYSLAADSDVCAGIQGDVVSRRVRIADCCYTWRMKYYQSCGVVWRGAV
ncbi:hypothetical protein BvCmsSINP010_02048 [Escherichia coli]|nr:hypothetical protein BvCms1485_00281 [Escherichia coli]GCQ72432.1 hypothetical protein BvCmsHHNP008_00040 [Escherichia coli]GDL11714.1 hypothetical protein BvCmsKSNP071_00280 [Escherichia coli]GDU36106.1 hypothetical protein BvCmsSINP010_02048 [Escherichia coli]